jgi:hypothetical protein
MFFTLEEMVMATDQMFASLTMGLNKEIERYRHGDSPQQRQEAADLLDALHKSLVDFTFTIKGLRNSFLDIDEGIEYNPVTDLEASVLKDLDKINELGYRPEVHDGRQTDF